MVDLKMKLSEEVWQKATLAPDLDPEYFRLDEEGSLIKKTDFNNESSIYGWCFFHLRPIWDGGNDDIRNLKPLNVINKILFMAGSFKPQFAESDYWD
ncbi:MAG: hypothetical protein KBF32_01835 [Chitinophagales bacterium]|nr:hypothetical protein [Chitinophagaceae bacterium]MBP9882113.1 hypothetical protein [Chitinophagales bacterium]